MARLTEAQRKERLRQRLRTGAATAPTTQAGTSEGTDDSDDGDGFWEKLGGAIAERLPFADTFKQLAEPLASGVAGATTPRGTPGRQRPLRVDSPGAVAKYVEDAALPALTPGKAVSPMAPFASSALQDLIRTYDAPRAAIQSGMKELADIPGPGAASGKDFLRQFDERKTASEYLDDPGLPGWVRSGWVRHPVGFVVDATTDPFTYVGGPSMAAARAGGRRALGQATAKDFMRNVLELEVKRTGRYGDEISFDAQMKLHELDLLDNKLIPEARSRVATISTEGVQQTAGGFDDAAKKEFEKALRDTEAIADDTKRRLAESDLLSRTARDLVDKEFPGKNPYYGKRTLDQRILDEKFVSTGLSGIRHPLRTAQQDLDRLMRDRDQIVGLNLWTSTPGTWGSQQAKREVAEGIKELLKPGGKVGRLSDDLAEVIMGIGQSKYQFRVKVPFVDKALSMNLPFQEFWKRQLGERRGPVSRIAGTEFGERLGRTMTNLRHSEEEAKLLNMVIRGDGAITNHLKDGSAMSFVARAQLANQIRSNNNRIAAGVAGVGREVEKELKRERDVRKLWGKEQQGKLKEGVDLPQMTSDPILAKKEELFRPLVDLYREVGEQPPSFDLMAAELAGAGDKLWPRRMRRELGKQDEGGVLQVADASEEHFGQRVGVVQDLIAEGILKKSTVDGVSKVTPARGKTWRDLLESDPNLYRQWRDEISEIEQRVGVSGPAYSSSRLAEVVNIHTRKLQRAAAQKTIADLGLGRRLKDVRLARRLGEMASEYKGIGGLAEPLQKMADEFEAGRWKEKGMRRQAEGVAALNRQFQERMARRAPSAQEDVQTDFEKLMARPLRGEREPQPSSAPTEDPSSKAMSEEFERRLTEIKAEPPDPSIQVGFKKDRPDPEKTAAEIEGSKGQAELGFVPEAGDRHAFAQWKLQTVQEAADKAMTAEQNLRGLSRPPSGEDVRAAQVSSLGAYGALLRDGSALLQGVSPEESSAVGDLIEGWAREARDKVTESDAGQGAAPPIKPPPRPAKEVVESHREGVRRAVEGGTEAVAEDLQNLTAGVQPMVADIIRNISDISSMRPVLDTPEGSRLAASLSDRVDVEARQALQGVQGRWEAHLEAFGDASLTLPTERFEGWKAVLTKAEKEITESLNLLNETLTPSEPLVVIRHHQAMRNRKAFELGSASRQAWEKINATPGLAAVSTFLAPDRASYALLRSRAQRSVAELDDLAAVSPLTPTVANARNLYDQADKGYRLLDEITELYPNLDERSRQRLEAAILSDANSLVKQADMHLGSPETIRGSVLPAIQASWSTAIRNAEQMTDLKQQEDAFIERVVRILKEGGILQRGDEINVEETLRERLGGKGRGGFGAAVRPVLEGAYEADVKRVNGFMEEFIRGGAGGNAFGTHLGVTLREQVNAGMYTSTDMAEIIESVAAYDDPGKLVRGARKLLGVWKGMAIASPGFNIRNAMSAGLVNLAAGVPLRTQLAMSNQYSLRALPRRGAVKVRATKDQPLQDFIELAERTGGIMNMGIKAQEDVASLGKAINTFQDANVHIENAVRLSMAYDTYQNMSHLSVDARMQLARDRVTKYHFDYGDISNVEQNIKLAIPFYTWMSRNWVMQAEMMARNPRQMVQMERAMRALDEDAPVNPYVSFYFNDDNFKQFGDKWFLAHDFAHIAPVKDFGNMFPAPDRPPGVTPERSFWEKLGDTVASTALAPFRAAAFAAEQNPALNLLWTAGFSRDLSRGYEVEGLEKWTRVASTLVPIFGRAQRIVAPKETQSVTNGLLSLFGVPLRESTPASEGRRRRQMEYQADAYKTKREEAARERKRERTQDESERRAEQAKRAWKRFLDGQQNGKEGG